MSFSKSVEIFVAPAQQDDAFNDGLEQRSGPLLILSRINVHQELLEASSEFFRNALRGTAWREAEERHIELEASTEVLQIFGNWLYGRDAGTTFAWPLWIDTYLFACMYLIDELAAYTIGRMAVKFGIQGMDSGGRRDRTNLRTNA